MKKILIAITAILFVTGISSAQFRIGVKAGVDIVSNKLNSDILNAKNRLGFQAGLVTEFMAPLGWGVEGSVLYGHKEYKIEEKEGNSDLTDYNYLSIPINLKKRFDITSFIGVFGVAGVYGDVRLSGNNLKAGVEEFKSKNFAMGFNCGFGFRLLKDIDLGIYYRQQLTDNFSTNKPELGDFKKKDQKNWSVSASYYF